MPSAITQPPVGPPPVDVSDDRGVAFDRAEQGNRSLTSIRTEWAFGCRYADAEVNYSPVDTRASAELFTADIACRIGTPKAAPGVTLVFVATRQVSVDGDGVRYPEPWMAS
jgi:hypothetical protein